LRDNPTVDRRKPVREKKKIRRHHCRLSRARTTPQAKNATGVILSLTVVTVKHLEGILLKSLVTPVKSPENADGKGL
jgi:hypothetical protein